MADLFSKILEFVNLDNNFDYDNVMIFLKALINKIMELFDNL